MNLLQDMLALARKHDAALYARMADRYDDLEAALASGNRRGERDRLLREAAMVLSPQERPWGQAKRLAVVVRRAERGVCRTRAERLVRQAMDCCPTRFPGSVRQLYRLLK
jgi:hypothetical protein